MLELTELSGFGRIQPSLLVSEDVVFKEAKVATIGVTSLTYNYSTAAPTRYGVLLVGGYVPASVTANGFLAATTVNGSLVGGLSKATVMSYGPDPTLNRISAAIVFPAGAAGDYVVETGSSGPFSALGSLAAFPLYSFASPVRCKTIYPHFSGATYQTANVPTIQGEAILATMTSLDGATITGVTQDNSTVIIIDISSAITGHTVAATSAVIPISASSPVNVLTCVTALMTPID